MRKFKEHGYLWWRSLLVSLCRGAPAAPAAAATNPARRRLETSPNGRFVDFCVISILFQRFARPAFSGFAVALAVPKTAVRRRAGATSVSRASL